MAPAFEHADEGLVGVKHSSSSPKGKDVPYPTTIEYSFGVELDDVTVDEATVALVPKTSILRGGEPSHSSSRS